MKKRLFLLATLAVSALISRELGYKAACIVLVFVAACALLEFLLFIDVLLPWKRLVQSFARRYPPL